MVLQWGFRCFSDIERNSTNKCFYAFSFLVGKHHEPQSINAIIPIGIVAYAFTLLWDNLCRNSCIAEQYSSSVTQALKSNTGEKSITPVQITHRNSGLWLAERKYKIFKANGTTSKDGENFVRKLRKKFPQMRKMASRKAFRHFLHPIFFMFVLLMSHHTVFLDQFGMSLYLWVFQKAETTLDEAARAILAFWKTHSRNLIPNWTRNGMITYTNFC